MDQLGSDRARRVRETLAAHVRAYREESADRNSIERLLGATLCHLLDEALRKIETWDSRFTWLDGLIPREIRIVDEGLVIEGGVYVMNGPRTLGVWPLRAEVLITRDGDALQTVRVLFGDRTPRPTPTNKEGRFDVRRLAIPPSLADWRFMLRI